MVFADQIAASLWRTCDDMNKENIIKSHHMSASKDGMDPCFCFRASMFTPCQLSSHEEVTTLYNPIVSNSFIALYEFVMIKVS